MSLENIVKISCELSLPSSSMTHNIGSLLHGALMEKLSSSISEQLHQFRYNPIKQRLVIEKGAAVWEVVCLEQTTSAELADVFASLNDIFLKRHNVSVPISGAKVDFFSLEGFVEKHMSESCPKMLVKLDFQSPTSFKKDKGYDIFPDVKKLLRSIMLNFDYFSPKVKIYDFEALDFFATQAKIIDYNLRSTRFSLEGIKIPSFRGKINLKLIGNTQTLQLLNLVLSFGELSGVGIKTSLGMGHMRIIG